MQHGGKVLKAGIAKVDEDEEVVEKDEILALQKMIDIAKETLTGNLQGIYGKGAKYDVLKGGGKEGAERFWAAMQAGGYEDKREQLDVSHVTRMMTASGSGRERVGIKGAANLIDVLTSPEFGDTMDISGVKRKGGEKQGYMGAEGIGAKSRAWTGGGWKRGRKDKILGWEWGGYEREVEGERGLDKGLLTSIRDWQKDIAEIISQEKFKMEFGMTRPEAFEKTIAGGGSSFDFGKTYGSKAFGPNFKEKFPDWRADYLLPPKKKPEEPLGQSLLAQEMQRKFDANIGQIQYEKAAGVGEFGMQLNNAAMDKVDMAGSAETNPTVVSADTHVTNNNSSTIIPPIDPGGGMGRGLIQDARL